MSFSRIPRIFWDIYGAEAWDNLKLPIMKKTLVTVVSMLKDKRVSDGEKVLDAGCGTGNFSTALAAEGFRVTGIDYSAGMLKCASSKVTKELAERLTFEQVDMNKPLPFADSSFDHVISISVMQTLADPGFALSELSRALKPGGTLIVMQVPKPINSPYAAIRQRVKHLESKKPTVVALTAVKVLLERARAKYWSPEELLGLLLANKKLNISYIDHGPPILIAAAKIKTHLAQSSNKF